MYACTFAGYTLIGKGHCQTSSHENPTWRYKHGAGKAELASYCDKLDSCTGFDVGNSNNGHLNFMSEGAAKAAKLPGWKLWNHQCKSECRITRTGGVHPGECWMKNGQIGETINSLDTHTHTHTHAHTRTLFVLLSVRVCMLQYVFLASCLQ